MEVEVRHKNKKKEVEIYNIWAKLQRQKTQDCLKI